MSESMLDYLKRVWMLWAILFSALLGGAIHAWPGYVLCGAAGFMASMLDKRITR